VVVTFAREFLDWWLSQLKDLLPGAGRGTAQRTSAVIVLTPLSQPTSAGAVSVRIERRGKPENIGHISLDRGGLEKLRRAAASLGRTPPTVIEVPPETVLEKELILPLAAERELDQVLLLAMDRETPFAADEIYWNGEIERRDRSARSMTVRLIMVAKAQIADLIATLSRAGLTPTAMIGVGSDHRRVTIPIDRGTKPRRSIAVASMSWACGALAAAAIAVPFVQQSIALRQVNDRIEALRPTVDMVERLRDRAVDDRRQIEALAVQRAALGDPLLMLAAVTAAIPDDTWLSTLEYSQGKLRLSGQSKAASHLIGDLSRSAALRNPEFTAPVTRAEDGKVDVFTIAAEMRK
jgi:general secretion pathway protein L